jgi:hypothetical protein
VILGGEGGYYSSRVHFNRKTLPLKAADFSVSNEYLSYNTVPRVETLTSMKII